MTDIQGTSSSLQPSKGRIIRFPSLRDDALSTGPSPAGPEAAVEEASQEASLPRRALLAASAEATRPFEAAPAKPAWRFGLTRRRRDVSRAEVAPAAAKVESESAADEALPEQSSVSQLITWLLNLRRGGIGSVYWNAAKLPLDVAITRAARLGDDAIIELVGHRLLIVEPLASHIAPAPRSGLDAVVNEPVEAGPGMVVP